MPGALDWCASPLTVVDGIYDECEGREEWIIKVKEYFQAKFADAEAYKKIPRLSVTPFHLLRDGQLVKFRCQVQDMYDDEYYQASYEVLSSSGTKKTRTTRFRETTSCRADERIVPSDSMDNIQQRTVMYCISLPGQNDWVTEALKEEGGEMKAPASSSSGIKRTAQSDDSEDEEQMDVQRNDTGSSKKQRTEASSSGESKPKPPPSLNLPVPDSTGVACLAKFYDGEPPEYVLNQVYELVGVISLSPELAAAADEGESFLDDSRGAAHLLPASVVPRLHVLQAEVLPHSNPLLPATAPALPASEAREARELLRQVLEEACLGDPLAGDILICYLLGNVSARQELVTVGQVPLNLSGVTPSLVSANFPSLFCEVLNTLISHSVTLPLTLSNLNTLPFVPRMDHSHHQLVSGVLQLPRLTHLILDETQLQEGTLDTAGIASFKQIENIIKNQRCSYQYDFTTVELETNINVLVFSEKKSLLQCDLELNLQPRHQNVDAAYRKVKEMLSPNNLKTLRQYITSACLAEFTMSERMQEVVQQEFVESRKEDKNAMTPEGFSRLLLLARLVSKSCGEADLTDSVWNSCKILEENRVNRLPRTERRAPNVLRV